jgi:hypothetical protein
MNDEIAHEEIAADTAAATEPGQTSQLTLEEQELALAREDPSVAALIEQQAEQAEQELALAPKDAGQIEAQFEEEAIAEVAKVDPQLAAELEAEVANRSAQPPIVAAPPSVAAIEAEMAQLAQEDPSLATELEGQQEQEIRTSAADPQEAAQIYEAFVATEVREVGAVDPALAQAIEAENTQANVTYSDAGSPTQGLAPTAAVIGDPTADESQWTYQGADGYCGPDSVSMMLMAATGVHLSEQQIEAWAAQHGDMGPLPPTTPDMASIGIGMTAAGAAATISHFGAAYGVKAELIENGTVGDLEGYLAQGREVMIGIDATRIWHDGTDAGQANHFVVVTGFDPATDTVYINDPGVPDGKAEAIPLSEFESAWETSGDVMIVTEPTGEAGERGGDDDEASAGASAGPVLLPIAIDGRLVRAA